MKARPIRCLISAGPTREYFDPVRFLSNPSSGKMGYALALAAMERGWHVDLVSGPVSLPQPSGTRVHRVVTGHEMYEKIQALFSTCDILIMTAAVMDYRPKRYSAQKLKKTEGDIVIKLEPVVDILKTVAAHKTSQLVVGFAAETDEIEANARRKLTIKNLDYMVANRVGRGIGFEADTNRVTLITADGTEETLNPDTKAALAHSLIERFARDLTLKAAVRAGEMA